MINNASVSPASAPHRRWPVLSAVFAAALMSAGIGTAQAMPVELSSAQFAAQIAGLTIVTETFEGFPAGIKASPLTLSNGTYTATAAPFIVNNDTTFCGDTDQCLVDQDTTDTRTFSAFPSGATFWATDFFAIGPADVFQVTVIGGSGTLAFTHIVAGGFWGFNDPLGLSSISFVNLGSNGFGNYSFDNVRTAAPNTSVPEPATLALVGLGLTGFRLTRKRRGLRPAG